MKHKGNSSMNIQNILAPVLSLIFLSACGGETADLDPQTPSTPSTPSDPSDPVPTKPSLGVQIDRMGRAAINTALNQTFQSDKDLKDAEKDRYNRAGPSRWAEYLDGFMASLAILDSLDTVCGNQLIADGADTRYAALAGVLVDDQLYIQSASGTCGTYLGLEAEVVGAVPPGAGGCGGRTPSDDVIERSYSVLAAGALAGIDDGIVADDGAQTDTFPFLGAPTPTN